MFSSFDISVSGLVAQRARLNAISSNLANMSTQVNEAGENKPYQPRFVMFETDDNLRAAHGGVGVRVKSVEQENVEPLMKYEPHSPLANAEGMVAYPNINMTREFVDALEATRAYEANVGVMEVSRDMNQQTLKILA